MLDVMLEMGVKVETHHHEVAPRQHVLLAVDDHGAPLTDPPPMQVRYPGGSIEACCFDGEDVILASEKGNIYRISAEDLAAGTRFLTAKQMHKRRRRK